MKRVILMLFAGVFALVGCDNTADNSPAFQANIDGEFFKAIDSRTLRIDGGVTIQGFSNDETITLHTSDIQLKTYEVGGESLSYAIYEDFNGTVYNSNPHGRGSITISDRCVSCGRYTGVFSFTAITETLSDTVVMNKGVFFEVEDGLPDDDTGGETTGDGTLSAIVDTIPFLPLTVTAVETSNAIVIAGGSASATILIRTPLDIIEGNYTLPTSGISVSYTDNGSTQDATNGNLSIIAHDVAAKTISGTFTFETNSHSIASGQFSVTYE